MLTGQNEAAEQYYQEHYQHYRKYQKHYGGGNLWK
jgi:hypothetical protein